MERKCNKCGSTSFYTEVKGNNTGLYCSKCGAWQKWLGKNEIRAFEQEQIEQNEMISAHEMMNAYVNYEQKWKFEKFKGDGAIYAFCPKCNFHYKSSILNVKTMKCESIFQYNYCPMCGEYLYDENESVNVIWNERDIVELYK